MKILFINTGPWGTGSFHTTDALMRVFEKHGHRVKMFFPDNGLPSEKHKLYYENDNYIIWKFPIRGDNISIDSFPLMLSDPNSRSVENPILFKNLSAQQLNFYFNTLKKTLNKIIETFKPDVIDTQHIWSNGYAVNQLGKKYFVTAHNSDQMAFVKDKRMQKFANEIAKKAMGIFVSTNFLKKKIIDLYHVNSEKIYISPNGYDQTVFQPEKVDRGKVLNELSLAIPNDATIVTCIGKISDTKGIDVLLKANLYFNEKDNIHFIVFGAGNIHQFLKQHHLPKHCINRIHFLGHQPAEIIAKVNNIAKLSILPSRNEGFPLAILESMGCGIPMVVSDRCGLNKIAVGESFPIKQPAALAGAIQKIIHLSEKKYQSLCKKALQAARQYNWEKIALRRLALYEKVLALH
jgi:glycosyltransferase involved in cell wall biosynthesis